MPKTKLDKKAMKAGGANISSSAEITAIFALLKASAPPTDVATLRAALAGGYGRLLGLPHFLTAQVDRDLISGQLQYWAKADDAVLSQLLAMTPKTK
jgi:hypothetical protein